MSYDNTVIENIKSELNHIDVATLQSMSELIDQFKRRRVALPQAVRDSEMPSIGATAPDQALKFVGKNLPLPEYEKLSIKERRMLARRVKEQNQSWLQENFLAREAAWLVVMDGQVIASGKSLKDQPMQPQIAEIHWRTGKFPFVFINDAFLTIEENTSAWHKTNAPGDLYPTLPITLSSIFGAVNN